MKKLCYIINFWLGERRCPDYRSENNGIFYLEKQIEFLSKVKHNIDTIIFNFNTNDSQYDILTKAVKLIPKKIQNSEVEVNTRQNIGMSYGAFSDCFVKNKDKYEYFLFNEDDYIFVEDFFDKTLIKMFNDKKKCGYLCMVVSDDFKRHASHSTGISTNKILSEVYEIKGELPHSKTNNYSSNEKEGQIMQSHSFIEIGYDVDDVRDKYRVYFSGCDGTWRWFHSHNKKEILSPVERL